MQVVQVQSLVWELRPQIDAIKKKSYHALLQAVLTGQKRVFDGTWWGVGYGLPRWHHW